MRKRIPLVIGILGLAALLLVYPVRLFTLSRDGGILFYRLAKPGQRFQLSYLHSVALSDVGETFQIDPEYRIVLVETRFQGQGTGLPSHPGEGEQIRRDGNWFYLTGMRRVVSSIPWRVQREWRSRFRFQTEPEANLSESIGSGLILIEVNRVSLASYIALLLNTADRI